MRTQLFINNEYVDAQNEETLAVYSPHDESLVADQLQIAGQEDVDKAVAAARAAFHGEWSRWVPVQRSAVMLKFADLVEQHADELALWESKCMGQAISTTKAIYQILIASFRYYAGWTDKLNGEQYPSHDGFYRIVQFDPIGVCAGIGAWNGAPGFFGSKVATAIAVGCTVIFKGSEKTPIGMLQLGDLVKEAGFPPGVINIITGPGSTGAMLASHMDINKISFTGSLATGKKIQELSAKSNLKRVVLELGGKSPSLIFDDANLNNALHHHSLNFLSNSGQACVAATRVFIQGNIAEAFIEQLKFRFEQVFQTAGSPLDPKTVFGPLADSMQFERVMNYIEIGKQESELITGGKRHSYSNSGYYVEPTIFLNPKDDAHIYREEIFGPVITIKTFKTEEEAIKLANDTCFGLSACIYTALTSRALRIAKQIDAGNVNINSSQSFNIGVPFGGNKQSGIGREGGRQGLMHFVEAKTISINMNV
ncbi:hypothetical protein COCMIDRAFT_37529 [Bipolaris oryzae ATCC 44560]|uniref:aldehyde dehydrogenase (NAD(+)) n=1 Tax=Bipolaris oryzae ATCC 44560 TaxID=930090 RepID=W6Z3T6_COCMI|nr:uncharacterized protein COCMIDRAFT_37529 [Bipolaris oryzae ATCC 44560]EUC44620.1 hypothetical protein COCMIDRAFT_37529 [Bipolaris oryzae ATCC 44560]